MADNVSMTIKSTSQTGKKLSRSITDIDPNATDSQLESLGNALNTLTTNHLSSLTRVQTSEIDTSQRYNISMRLDNATDPAFTLQNNKITCDRSKLTEEYTGCTVIFNINGNIEIPGTTLNITLFDLHSTSIAIDNNNRLYFEVPQDIQTGTITLTIPAGTINAGGNSYPYNAFTFTFENV